MTLEEAVLQNLRELPPDQRKAVLDFTEFLRSKTTLPKAAPSLKGLWADLDVDISEDDISTARQEMWSSFPREIASATRPASVRNNDLAK